MNPFGALLAFILAFGTGMICYHAFFGGMPAHAFTVMRQNFQYTILECTIVRMKDPQNSKRAYLLIRNGGKPIYCYVNLQHAPYSVAATLDAGQIIYWKMIEEDRPARLFLSAKTKRLFAFREGDVLCHALPSHDALPMPVAAN